MSTQSIDLSAVKNMNFNGTEIKTMNLNGSEIWKGSSSGNFYLDNNGLDPQTTPISSPDYRNMKACQSPFWLRNGDGNLWGGFLDTSVCASSGTVKDGEIRYMINPLIANGQLRDQDTTITFVSLNHRTNETITMDHTTRLRYQVISSQNKIIVTSDISSGSSSTCSSPTPISETLTTAGGAWGPDIREFHFDLANNRVKEYWPVNTNSVGNVIVYRQSRQSIPSSTLVQNNSFDPDLITTSPVLETVWCDSIARSAVGWYAWNEPIKYIHMRSEA